MQKNDVLRCGESIVRVLDIRENQVLIVTYPQKSVPLWINQEELIEYQTFKEREISSFPPEFEELSPDQRRIAYERYTLIAGILPFIGDERQRCTLIARISEEKGISKVNEGVIPEFIGIVNYAIMGLIQLETGPGLEMTHEETTRLYHSYFQKAKKLMLDKNHDYDEVWRHMRISSYTDLILMKINRTKQIEDHQGNTVISEGIDANYYDMINYAVFGLIRLVVEQEKP